MRTKANGAGPRGVGPPANERAGGRGGPSSGRGGGDGGGRGGRGGAGAPRAGLARAGMPGQPMVGMEAPPNANGGGPGHDARAALCGHGRPPRNREEIKGGWGLGRGGKRPFPPAPSRRPWMAGDHAGRCGAKRHPLEPAGRTPAGTRQDALMRAERSDIRCSGGTVLRSCAGVRATPSKRCPASACLCRRHALPSLINA
jgi:hypothetical protein